jgi:ribonuclease HI
MRNLVIYTDGGARGNPGPAGVGVIFYDGKGEKIKEMAEFIGNKTNNQAEYNGLILALREAIKLKPRNVEVYLDSELVVNQINGEYRVKNKDLKILFEEAKRLADKFESIFFHHTLREGNKEADKLVNQVIDRKIK